MIFKYSLIVLMVGALTVNCSSIYYVTAEGKEHDCPLNETCHNLSYYYNEYLFSYDLAHFLLFPGTHYIQDGQGIIINANHLVIEGYNATMIQGFHQTVQQSTVIIQCIGQTGGILIIRANNITLSGITIIDCGFDTSRFVPQSATPVFYSLLAVDTSNLFLYNISIQKSTEYGLGTININNLMIESCSFARNGRVHSTKLPCHKEDICTGGGNAVISYSNIPLFSIIDTIKVNIANSNFSFSNGKSSGDTSSSGILVSIVNSAATIDITLDSIVAYGNIGNLGANIVLFINDWGFGSYKFTLKNSLSTMANYQEEYSLGTSLGGGFLAIISPTISLGDPYHSNTIIQIINSTFTNNAATYGGGICVLQLKDSTSTSIEVISSIIENNSGIIGIGIAVVNILTVHTPLDNLIITNTSISSSVINYFTNDLTLSTLGSFKFKFDIEHLQLKYFGSYCNIDDVALFSSAIGLVNVQNVTLNNNIIKDNAVSGIRGFHSRVIFKGNYNVIESNIGSNGGGLALLNESFLVLDPPTRVSFINNSAIRGGGIFTDEPLSSTNNTCFYAIQSHHDHPSISLIFKSNKAIKGGSVVYGEDIDNCLPHPDYNSSFLSNSSRDIFDMIFDYSKELGNSIISSNPFKVCLCEDSVANCTRRIHWLSSAPGGTVDLQVVLVGDQDGFSTGTLSIRPNNLGHLSFASILTTTAAECQNLSIPVILNDTSITSTDLVSSVNTNIIGRTIEEMTITISIEKCPIGFELHNSTGRCNCDSLLTSNFPNTICDVTKGLITKISSGWIGLETSENSSSSCILLDSKCPFNYCVTNTTITLEDQSQQCSMNRSGILCGQCKGNYSLMLGSNECGECPHYGYLALLIVFIVAGVALVVLLIVLNLTVSMSTINGLIFFANIVHINENSILISTGHTYVLSHFISWINLDFGFKVCFYPGMDSYAKTWLQFAFPFYIWFVTTMIILSAKCSIRISKVVSRNVVSVLATLILLSYTKLFRSIIFSFYRSNLISNCNSINTIVWSVDGSINYFGLKHAPLFILSLMVLVLLIVPFTLSLLLSPLLESYLSRYKLFKWWVKVKPFIDAYNGPYKDRYRFWTGLLLLARLMMVLTVSFSNNLDVDRLVTLTVTVMLLSFSWMVNGVYTNRHSNTLEWFFIGNLAITISVSGYSDPLIRQILVYSCVSLSLMVFLGIISYHIWVRCSENDFIKKLAAETKKDEVPSQTIDVPQVDKQRRMSDVDIINRGKQREDIPKTEWIYEKVTKKESVIVN